MQIDPYAWLFTFPLAVALLRVQTWPADHAAVRLWRELQERESLGWQWLGLTPPLDLNRAPRVGRLILRAAVATLILGSLASFLAFLAA